MDSPTIGTIGPWHAKGYRVGLYGGSFNPIHVGHVALAKALLHEAQLDEVWFMVSPQNPLKVQQQLLDDQSRLHMVELALANEPRLRPCDYEFRLPRPSYTLHTLRALHAQWPEIDFTLIIGADNWAVFDHWRGYKEILRDYAVCIYPRRGYPITLSALPKNVQLANTPMFDVCSTDIRRRVRESKSIEGLVPDSIISMVQQYYSHLSVNE